VAVIVDMGDVDFDNVDDVVVIVIVDDMGDAEQSQSAPLQYLASPRHPARVNVSVLASSCLRVVRTQAVVVGCQTQIRSQWQGRRGRRVHIL